MANYPTSAPSFSNKSAGQTIDASHINSLQDEVVAIGGGLINGTAPLASSNSTVANLSVLGNSTFGAGIVMGNSTTATLSSGDTADLVIPSTVMWIRTSASANGSTLTSMGPVAAGRLVGIINNGANALVIANDAGGTANQRFVPGTTLAAGQNALFVYLSDRWRGFGI